MWWYSECPICKICHDDGEVVDINGETHFICLDCAEDYTNEEKIVLLKSRNKQKAAVKIDEGRVEAARQMRFLK